MSLTYLSVCSGIEAASVAWQPLGWTRPLECIGEAPTLTQAMQIAMTEHGRAIVRDLHCKRVYDNGQPIEERA